VAGLWAVVLLGAGGMLTEVGPWYKALRKPALQPPAWMFAPAWSTILALAAWAGVLAWQGAGSDAARWTILVAYAVNFVLHVLWTPLFFKAKRPDWSLVEVPLLLLSVVSLMAVVGRDSALAPWLLAPYLVWVAFAVYLNWMIVRLNGPFRA
jgi:tryptophan-rich sensory protein